MNDINTNVPDKFVKQEIDKLFIRYKEYVSEATELRQSFQQALASVRAIDINTNVSKEIAIQERVEAQRLTAARIQRMNGTSKK